MINKTRLFKQIQLELESVYQVAVCAAQRAYDTATDEENKAENKYDTLGLEASYLAHGQSQRVAECEADLVTFKKLKLLNFLKDKVASLGALFHIKDENNVSQFVFLSPVAGGLKITFDQKEISLITPSSPLGRVLMSAYVGDDVAVKLADKQKHYHIINIE